jgi:hypothetical protein
MRFGDIKPVLQTGGSSMEPALTIANEVMGELCAKIYNWKWNSFLLPPFYTISWQNDYAIPGVTNLGWLENGYTIDINSSQIPKRKFKMEVVKDMQSSSDSYGRPFQVCWEFVNVLNYGSWGSGAKVPNVNNTSQTNPGPGVVYTQPLGAATTPSNPCTQILDTNGNIQVVTTYGTCGNNQPTWPISGAPAGTTTTDGSVVWTVIDPQSKGFRLQNIPTQAGNVWQINLRGQFLPVRFVSLGQFINPIPDDFSMYFMQGFRAKCYERSPEEKVRAKYSVEYALWLKALHDSQEQDSREPDSFGFYPSDDIMGYGFDSPYPRADQPYGPW